LSRRWVAFFLKIAIKGTNPVYKGMEKELQNKSLDRFFRQEYHKLVNYIRRNMEERFMDSSPEDIVQDVMLGIINRLDLDEQIVNLTAYIWRSVKNRIADFRTKKQRDVPIGRLTGEEGETSLSGMVSVQLTDDETEYRDISPEQLHLAIRKLKPDEQAVIMATEFESHSYEELSLAWNVPLGTLLSRKHRALAKLQALLVS
jgi:RNA polymerase sigma factor (sigma-70 family)